MRTNHLKLVGLDFGWLGSFHNLSINLLGAHNFHLKNVHRLQISSYYFILTLTLFIGISMIVSVVDDVLRYSNARKPESANTYPLFHR